METPVPASEGDLRASPRVAAIVMASRSADLTSVFESIVGQVYEPTTVFVVSDERPKANVAAPHAQWASSVSDVVAAVQDTAEFVWLLHPEAVPRPDALAAMVSTAERVDASVVGSKLLDPQRSDELVSVGGATDVFGYPYTGLDQGEVDQEQYDVIRDVAYVEPASMLVRRDLAAGLGGFDPKLPHLSSGLDFCQRARLAGGRVVVAPTSEVKFSGGDRKRASTWREQAGRLRVMLKCYSLLTLLWALPGLAIIGLVLGVYRTFNGTPTALADWARAWIWNVLHFPSTLAARRGARGSSLASDKELFRYQVNGSVELRAVASALGGLLADEATEDDEDLAWMDEASGFWQQPAFLAAVFGTVFVAAFTRVIWSEGMPSTGFALPLADSAWDTLRAYAGGWNAGGLGSSQPIHPAVGATASVQLLFGSKTALAATVMTVGSVALGAIGMARLVRRLGLGPSSRYLSGAVFVAGAPMVAVTQSGYWPALLAAGGLPWVLAGVVQPLPVSPRLRVGRIAQIALAMIWMSMMMPVLIVVPLGFGLTWSLATRTARPLFRAVAVSIIALPMLFPWLLAQTPQSLYSSGAPLHFDPRLWVMIPALLASVLIVLAGRGVPARVAVIGTLVASFGILLSRASTLGAGRDVTAGGGVLAAFGIALVVAAALGAMRELDAAGALRRSAAQLGVMAAVVAVLLVVTSVPAGLAGLGEDQYQSLAFAETRGGVHGTDRLLLMGPAATLPGEFRRLDDGTAYRVTSGVPTFDQAWLPESRAGDEALERTIEALADGSELRPGEALGEFGIRWIVFTGDAPLQQVMTSQLDLRPLPQLVYPVFESEVDSARAVTDRGVAWTWERPDYVGPPVDGRIRLAENADPRWGPGEWEQRDWANEVSSSDGFARFGGVPRFRFLAQLAGVIVLVLLFLAVWGRPARSLDSLI